MGIKDLKQLLQAEARSSIKERKMTDYRQRIIALDASMCIYQFMSEIRKDGDLLRNNKGEETSHLKGMLQRTSHFLKEGVKPVYVFDGSPPELKKAELARREALREFARDKVDYLGAFKDGDKDIVKDEMDAWSKMTIKADRRHYDSTKTLLRLMGVPFIQAPGEAEAQCAKMCKDRVADAASTDDMDCLAFGTPKLLRRFTVKNKDKVEEYDCAQVLKDLRLTMDQLVDVCVLSGCDYCEEIKDMTSKDALDLVHQHGSIESFLKNKDSKYQIPDAWPYKAVQDEFKNPKVSHVGLGQLKWTDPNPEGLRQFLAKDNDFGAERLEDEIRKLQDYRSNRLFPRLDDMFGGSKRRMAAEAGSSSKKPKV